MSPYGGAYVRLRGTSNHTGEGHMERGFFIYDKRGSICLLVEDFNGIGPRLELIDGTRNLQVDIRQWVYHRETRRSWP